MELRTAAEVTAVTTAGMTSAVSSLLAPAGTTRLRGSME